MVLVDLHLPDMAGRDVVRALASDPATSDIPVIVLSANAVRPYDRDARIEGARAYLTKPFQIESLLALVDRVRQERDASAAGDDTVIDADRVTRPHGSAQLSNSETEARELRS
jgi:CheY-like chemotaxis protein